MWHLLCFSLRQTFSPFRWLVLIEWVWEYSDEWVLSYQNIWPFILSICQVWFGLFLVLVISKVEGHHWVESQTNFWSLLLPSSHQKCLLRSIFCSTSFPLASTRWVLSTFSSHCQRSSKQCRWLTSATSTIFSSENVELEARRFQANVSYV